MNPNDPYQTYPQHPEHHSGGHNPSHHPHHQQQPQQWSAPVQPMQYSQPEPMHPPQQPQQPQQHQQPFEHQHGQNNGVRPMPVVKVLSPFGVEYVFLTISLFIAAFALTGALLLLVNGETAFSSLAFPVAMLVVALPAFAGLFLHLKKMELRMPELKLDASKRRSTQFTQIVAFLTCMFTLIGFIFAVFASIGGTSDISVGKSALNSLCILAVAGGILAYYWHDEHVIKR